MNYLHLNNDHYIIFYNLFIFSPLKGIYFDSYSLFINKNIHIKTKNEKKKNIINLNS